MSFAASVRTRGEVTRWLRDFLARLHPGTVAEQHRRTRAPLCLLMRLTPVDDLGRPNNAETVSVVSKDISAGGIGFSHEHPLACRRAYLSFEHPDAGPFAAEVDLRWCRFTQAGQYESGGRLLRLVDLARAG